MVPYELHDNVRYTILSSYLHEVLTRCKITPDDWHMRLTAIRDMSFHYYKPLFERIWFMVATL